MLVSSYTSDEATYKAFSFQLFKQMHNVDLVVGGIGLKGAVT